jgi:hypothetical protein
MWYLNTKPFKGYSANSIEVINEVCFLACSYFIFLFTDFVPDVETRYNLGKVQIYLVMGIFIFNFVLVA